MNTHMNRRERAKAPIQFRKTILNNTKVWTLRAEGTLVPGTVVTVPTRNGPREVTVGDIVDTSHGITLALVATQVPGWAREILREGKIVFKSWQGTWCICGPASLLRPGRAVSVQTRRGESQWKRVAHIVHQAHGVAVAQFGEATNPAAPQPWESHDPEYVEPDVEADVA